MNELTCRLGEKLSRGPWGRKVYQVRSKDRARLSVRAFVEGRVFKMSDVKTIGLARAG